MRNQLSHIKEKKFKIWKNTIKNVKVKPFRYFIPKHINEISEIIQVAEQQGYRVRAVGSGHSFNDCAATEGYLIDLSKINFYNKKLPGFIKTQQDKTFVEVGAGITIQKLNKKLDKDGLALTNMGGIDEQTISGAISTDTHGSGRDFPGLSGMVRSIVLVSTGGQKHRIEPKYGPTDPDKHHEKGIVLIQDDDTFNACLVSLGCMGVIYSYVIEVKKAYDLFEEKKLTTWREAKQLLLSKDIFKKTYKVELRKEEVELPLYSVFILVSPYIDKKTGKRHCVIARQMNVEPPNKRKLKEKTRNLLSTIVGNLPFAYWRALISVNWLKRGVPNLVNSSLKSVQDNVFIDKSHKVLHQGIEYLQKRIYGFEFAYDIGDLNPVSESKDPAGEVEKVKKAIFAIESVLDRIEDLAENFDIFISSTIVIRFVQASNALITPEYKRNVLYVNNPMFRKQHSSELAINTLQQIHLHNNGIPHWGKVNDLAEGQIDRLKEWYPRLEKWQEVVNCFNPLKTFNNRFSDRMLLTQKQREAKMDIQAN